MSIVFLVARILLGLMFTVFGLNGFLHFIPSPHPDGLVAQFLGALFQSHYAVLIFAVQLLGAVLANILTFHVTMQPAGLPMALLATLLWVVTAWPLRATFALIFARKPQDARGLSRARYEPPIGLGAGPLLRKSSDDRSLVRHRGADCSDLRV